MLRPRHYLLAMTLLTGALLACEPASEPTATTSAGTSRSGTGTQVAEDLSLNFRQLAQQVVPAVVSISTQTPDAKRPMPDDDTHAPFQQPEQMPGGLGSGVIVDAQAGYILTNNHVIQGADRIQVTLQNGKRLSAKLIGSDPPTDLAVLQISGGGSLKAAVLGDSTKTRVGEWVLAIGSPFGLDSTVTAGIISAQGRANVGVADFEDFIQTDAAINPGNSGGALVNTRGEIIGINTAIATQDAGYMGVGFAIPSNMARQVMKDLIADGQVTRSQLGVYIGEMDEDLRLALKLKPQQQGILVMEVIAGTPAAEIGFQKYDLIVRLNGEPVSEVAAFRNRIALTAPDTTVSVEVLRAGETLMLKPLLRRAVAEQAQTPARSQAWAERLGFEVQPLSEAERERQGLRSDVEGLMVSRIDSSSTAYRRGLRQHDVITEINRQPVSALAQLEEILGAARPGDAVLLNLLRQGQIRILAFELPG